ncbi:MAG: hypothetical protein AB1481_00025 [Candidatus Omnitrophota bacterium]
MISESTFKKSIFISLLGHLAIFSIFSFSFGNKLLKGIDSPVYFWGQFLGQAQVTERIIRDGASDLKNPVFEILPSEPFNLQAPFIKPNVTLPFYNEKEAFRSFLSPVLPFLKKRQEEIIFHPVLPHDFRLYFKDRQVAHIELAFNIPPKEREPIQIKRSIASGNPEVDLMSMRYISHFLFIQRSKFVSNGWHALKIDLTVKND